MNLEEVLQNLRKCVDRYANISLFEVNELSEILRDLGVNVSYLTEIRKEYYNDFQIAYKRSLENSHAAKEREAMQVVPELDYIRKVLKNYSDLKAEIRTQISLHKNNE